MSENEREFLRLIQRADAETLFSLKLLMLALSPAALASAHGMNVETVKREHSRGEVKRAIRRFRAVQSDARSAGNGEVAKSFDTAIAFLREQVLDRK